LLPKTPKPRLIVLIINHLKMSDTMTVLYESPLANKLREQMQKARSLIF